MTEPRVEAGDRALETARKIVRTPEQIKFASELSLLKEKAFRIGLYATGQLLEKPLRMVGYELAGTPELYEKMEAIYAKAAQ